MALNRAHDWSIRAVSALVAGGGLWYAWGVDISLTAGLAVLVGGYYLSPDLDTYSIPYRRWGILRWWWKPYQKLFRHRSFFTHSPLVGTAVRLAWLMPFWFWLFRYTEPNPRYLWATLAGIELSALVHLFLDL